MSTLLRAVITGFGLSLGAALYKRVSKELGIGDGDDADKAGKSPDDAGPPHVPNDKDGDGEIDPDSDGNTDADDDVD